LKSLISGKTIATTFHVSNTANEAEINKQDVKFLYKNKGEYWFCGPEDPKNRFKLDASLIGNTGKFLKTNENVTALV